MNGGIISGNSSSSGGNPDGNSGAGVWIEGNSTINKKGGIIYGYEDGNPLSNVVKNGSSIVSGKGHAVYYYGGGDIPLQYRDSTLREDDDIYLSNKDYYGWD
jgi:hypothetical protein